MAACVRSVVERCLTAAVYALGDWTDGCRDCGHRPVILVAGRGGCRPAGLVLGRHFVLDDHLLGGRDKGG